MMAYLALIPYKIAVSLTKRYTHYLIDQLELRLVAWWV